jgi:tripartite-type tricarboxylate transporter receptor subunit TctC
MNFSRYILLRHNLLRHNLLRHHLVRSLVALLLALSASFVSAQWSPTKPVRIVVPFPAGGIVDLMARTVSDRLSASLGQAVIVDARPGANGSIGIDAVAKADPDGHTILLATLSNATLPGFVSLPWHPTRDFAGVAMLGQVPNLVVVPATLEPKTLKEFVDYAKARPGALNYANGGNGTSPTLGVERLKKNTGMQLVGIGYKGFPPVIPDLISGQLHFSMVPIGVAAPHVKSGKLRALAVAAPVRNKQFPDVPTMAEAGYPESPVISWYAFLVPAATPKPVIERLNREIAKATAEPEVLARIETIGGSSMAAGTPAEVDAMLLKEVDFWSKFIKETGLKIE